MRKFFDIRSLPVQMITAFMAVVLLTAATVGLPAIWLLQNQLDHQAWSQVAQGQRAGCQDGSGGPLRNVRTHAAGAGVPAGSVTT